MNIKTKESKVASERKFQSVVGLLNDQTEVLK